MQTYSPDHLRRLALSNLGAFNAMYAHAPKAIRFQGQTYVRDASQTVEQKLAFLAMASTSNPKLIKALADGAPFGLDAPAALDPDSSGVESARAAVVLATRQLGDAKANLNGVKREIAQMEANLKESQEARSHAGDVGPGSILSLGISNAVEHIKWDGQIQHWKDRIRAAKTGIEEWAGRGEAQLSTAVEKSRNDLAAAKSALAEAVASRNAALRQARQEEEAARASLAANEAAAAQIQAEGAARMARADQWAAEPLPEVSEPTGDEGEYMLDAEARADDVYGDGFGADMQDDAFGPDVNGARAAVSPYGLDIYYSDDDGELAYGIDWGAVSTIIGGVLVAAPSIINTMQSPPSVETAQANKDAPPAWLTALLKQTGAQAVIDDAAKKSGKAAGESNAEKLMPWVVGIGGAILLVGIVVLATRK